MLFAAAVIGRLILVSAPHLSSPPKPEFTPQPNALVSFFSFFLPVAPNLTPKSREKPSAASTIRASIITCCAGTSNSSISLRNFSMTLRVSVTIRVLVAGSISTLPLPLTSVLRFPVVSALSKRRMLRNSSTFLYFNWKFCEYSAPRSAMSFPPVRRLCLWQAARRGARC